MSARPVGETYDDPGDHPESICRQLDPWDVLAQILARKA